MHSVKDKAISGIKWNILDNLANSGITFLVGIVLARILTPAEFGVIGLVTVFISISNVIVDGGFSTALIRKTNESPEDRNTIFYSNLAFSLFLTVVLIFTSRQIAVFFEVPELEHILPIMSSLLIINALSIIQRTVLIKEINFKLQAKISLIASLGSGVIGIGMALMNFGVWSLVAQQISRQLLLSIFLWFFNRWRPTFSFSKDSFKELFGFGSKLLLANLINTIYRNLFLTIVGKMYNTDQLGKYTRADQFNQILTNNLTLVIQKVSFPAFCKLQDETEKLRYAFRRTMLYTAMVSFPLVLGMGIMAKPMILLLIGEKWIDSVILLQIMCLYGILYPLSNLNLSMLNVHGSSHLFLKLEVIKKILFIPVFAVGFFFELKYMLVAALIYYYIEFYINGYYTKSLYGYSVWQQVKDLAPVFFISAGVTGIAYTLTFLNVSNLLTIILQVAVITALYPLAFRLFPMPEFKELKDLAMSQVSLIIKK